MVNRRRNQRGGVESEGATFMSEQYFKAMPASSNAETVTSGDGSFPPMSSHNLMTGIPLKGAPGTSVLMGGRRRRQRGGEEAKNALIMTTILPALQELSMEDLQEIANVVRVNTNAIVANTAAAVATNAAANAIANNNAMPVAVANAANAAAKANAAAAVVNSTTAMNSSGNMANMAANAAAMNAATANVAANVAANAAANAAAANAALPGSNSMMMGGRRKRVNRK